MFKLKSNIQYIQLQNLFSNIVSLSNVLTSKFKVFHTQVVEITNRHGRMHDLWHLVCRI